MSACQREMYRNGMLNLEMESACDIRDWPRCGPSHFLPLDAIKKVKSIILDDRRITLREISDILCIHFLDTKHQTSLLLKRCFVSHYYMYNHDNTYTVILEAATPTQRGYYKNSHKNCAIVLILVILFVSMLYMYRYIPPKFEPNSSIIGEMAGQVSKLTDRPSYLQAIP